MIKQMHISIAIVFSLFILSAKPTEAAIMPVVVTVFPESLTANGQYFDVSIGGLENYVDNLKISRPDVYVQLILELDRLRAKRNLSWVVAGAGVATGGAMMIYGWQAGPVFMGEPQPHAGLMVGGVGVIALGMFATWYIQPDRKDYMNFLNKSNSLTPDSQLRWQLGFDIHENAKRGNNVLAYASLRF
jgi:hypothetical protein